MLSLTCDQVRECPHRALQLCRSSWVPPHILGVALIKAAQFVDVLLNVRHFCFNLLHAEKYTPHLAAVFRKCQKRVNKLRIHRISSHLLFKTKQNFRVDEPTLICVPPRSRVQTHWFRFLQLAFSARVLPDTLLLHQHPTIQHCGHVDLRRARYSE